ncbi:VWA domain-containing protein [Thalassotalea mangrovi]|uniref:VWA domain-containing protein n=1 Tax=Thalassotalea mangrovi TaxID=2572245 RepID=A0A4U1B650_9GAMM|nr:VWA domain-containing protein [Thalassotalea mangrovi]TKB45888.1 VWA domain-containing protein [Thalassotalea mangrovi]
MIEFVYPWNFVLLPVPLAVYFLLPPYKERKSSVKVPFFTRLVELTGEKPASGSVILNRIVLQKLLLVLGWILLCIAMAKPQYIGDPITSTRSARDLMVAVDLSASMNKQDFESNEGITTDRFSGVQSLLIEFVKQRQSDRLGLILFADAPYLQAPFTDDLDAWITLLQQSEVGMAGQSTALGDAIGLAISVFENTGQRERVLLLLTDGKDTGSKVPPRDAAQVAANFDITIYPVAIGNPATGGDEAIDLAVLDYIATTTNGQLFKAEDGNQLRDIYAKINELEPEKYSSRSYRPKTSIHYLPIIILVIMYLLTLSLVAIRQVFHKHSHVKEVAND